MREYFAKITNFLLDAINKTEVLILNFDAEITDFIRLNKSLIRQAGNVTQLGIHITLIIKNKTLKSSLRLSSDFEKDSVILLRTLSYLRREISELPNDPYLMYEKSVNSSDLLNNTNLNSYTITNNILSRFNSVDMVGILSLGKIIKGFSNSLGQFNWHESESFNFDWSLYSQNGKAVKHNYADNNWNEATFSALAEESIRQLEVVDNNERKLNPGKYKVYLSPSALNEVIDMMSWGGFSYKANRVGSSPLYQMFKGNQSFHKSINFIENLSNGIAPMFHSDGFVKPEKTDLILDGVYQNSLVSPRSALEYSVKHNAAEYYESPVSIELNTGSVQSKNLLSELKNGIYINNLWYLNFSDRNNGRITGLTRFGCFEVQNGEFVGPINTMRFDETLYNIFGEKLIGLTNKQQLIMDTSTYEERSSHSSKIPGAVVDDFSLTL